MDQESKTRFGGYIGRGIQRGGEHGGGMAEGRQGWRMGHTECARECWLNGSKTKGVKNTNMLPLYSLFAKRKRITSARSRGGEGESVRLHVDAHRMDLVMFGPPPP